MVKKRVKAPKKTKHEVESKRFIAQRIYTEGKGMVTFDTIAEVLGVTKTQLKLWSVTDKWDRIVHEKTEQNPIPSNRVRDIIRSGAKFRLTEQEETFCFEYIAHFSTTLAANKAGYTHTTYPDDILSKKQVSAFIRHLIDERNTEIFVKPMDVIKQYAKIAFSDIGEFVKIADDYSTVTLKLCKKIDGQLVKEMREDANGHLHVKLWDKMKALKALEQYLGVMPKDWKESVDRSRLKLMRERLQLEKDKLYGPEGEADMNDGFIEALKNTSENLWDD